MDGADKQYTVIYPHKNHKNGHITTIPHGASEFYLAATKCNHVCTTVHTCTCIKHPKPTQNTFKNDQYHWYQTQETMSPRHDHIALLPEYKSSDMFLCVSCSTEFENCYEIYMYLYFHLTSKEHLHLPLAVMFQRHCVGRTKGDEGRHFRREHPKRSNTYNAHA